MIKPQKSPLTVVVFLVVAVNLVLLFILVIRRDRNSVNVVNDRVHPTVDAVQHSNPSRGRASRIQIITIPTDSAEQLARGLDETLDRDKSPGDEDVIENDYVLRFRSEKELAEFIRRAKDYGVDVVDILKGWSAVRLRVRDRAELDYLLGMEPTPIDYSNNYYTRVPDSPKKRVSKVSLDSYTPFGNTAPVWLGLDNSKDFRGDGVVVAVLDTGVVEHAALAHTTTERVSLIPDEQSIDGEFNGHGTAVASIIAGGSPDAPGIAPNSEILSIQVMNSDGLGDAFTLARGIWEAVDLGADIIVMSLGTQGDAFILKAAVDYALENDVAVVAATGNDSYDLVAYPARYNGVVGVSAIDATGQHAAFSNTGSDVDIAAPGIGINAAWINGDVVSFSGTSSAAPFVAGTLAGIMSASPELNASGAIETLLNYTHDAGAPGWDPEFGSGILSIGWIQSREEKGIRDIALTSHYLDPNSVHAEMIEIIVSAQNQGTESLSKINMTVTYDGEQENLEFYDIGVGETVSEVFQISAARLQEMSRIKISSEVSINGGDDKKIENNTKNSVIIYDDGSNDNPGE